MKPMMADSEIQLISNLIFMYKPKHCLEWGSGGSTIYFPKTHKSLRWLAVEHNGNWVKKVASELPDNANVVWVPEDEWYVDCVKHSRTFDFILIDGQHRERCLEIARQIVSEDGIILLHDSGRKEYQQFIDANEGEKLCDGEIREGNYYAHRGLTMFRKKYAAS